MISFVGKPASLVTLTLVCLAAPLVLLAQQQDTDRSVESTQTFTFDGDLNGTQQAPAARLPTRQAGSTDPLVRIPLAQNPPAQDPTAPPAPPVPPRADPLPPAAPAPIADPLITRPNAGPSPPPPIASIPSPPAPAPSVWPSPPRISPRDTEDIGLEINELRLRRESYMLRIRGLEQMSEAKRKTAAIADSDVKSLELEAESQLLLADSMLAQAELVGLERRIRRLEQELDAMSEKVDPTSPEPEKVAPTQPARDRVR